jgi:predicted Rossmann fold nucleotide-binding protein DprA/Smf involved in DNA uptake
MASTAAHLGVLGSDRGQGRVLASGLSYGYPNGHHELFAAVVGQGW